MIVNLLITQTQALVLGHILQLEASGLTTVNNQVSGFASLLTSHISHLTTVSFPPLSQLNAAVTRYVHMYIH